LSEGLQQCFKPLDDSYSVINDLAVNDNVADASQQLCQYVSLFHWPPVRLSVMHITQQPFTTFFETRRALGRAHLPPTKVFQRLSE